MADANDMKIDLSKTVSRADSFFAEEFDLSVAEAEIEEFETEINEITSDIVEYEYELNNYDPNSQEPEIVEQHNRLREKYENAINELAEIQKEKDEKNQEITEYNAEKQGIIAEAREECTAKNSKIDSEIAKIEGEIKRQTEHYKKQKEHEKNLKISAINDRIGELESDADSDPQKKQEIEDLKKKKGNITADHENVIANYETYIKQNFQSRITELNEIKQENTDNTNKFIEAVENGNIQNFMGKTENDNTREGSATPNQEQANSQGQQYGPETQPSQQENQQYQPENQQYQPENQQYQPENQQSQPENQQYQPENQQSQPENQQYQPGNQQYQPGNQQYQQENQEYQPIQQNVSQADKNTISVRVGRDGKMHYRFGEIEEIYSKERTEDENDLNFKELTKRLKKYYGITNSDLKKMDLCMFKFIENNSEKIGMSVHDYIAVIKGEKYKQDLPVILDYDFGIDEKISGTDKKFARDIGRKVANSDIAITGYKSVASLGDKIFRRGQPTKYLADIAKKAPFVLESGYNERTTPEKVTNEKRETKPTMEPETKTAKENFRRDLHINVNWREEEIPENYNFSIDKNERTTSDGMNRLIMASRINGNNILINPREYGETAKIYYEYMLKSAKMQMKNTGTVDVEKIIRNCRWVTMDNKFNAKMQADFTTVLSDEKNCQDIMKYVYEALTKEQQAKVNLNAIRKYDPNQKQKPQPTKENENEIA